LPRFEVVLFDLDGTLVDSTATILDSFHYTTEVVLGRRVPDDEILAQVGGGNLHMQMALIDETQVDELVRVYREHNNALYLELSCFAGIVDLLDELKRQGCRLGVVSAKRRETVELAFQGAGLDGYFDAVVGSDATTKFKPDPEPILHALGLLGADPATAAYVGDSPFDAAAAKAAGVYAIAVAWGGIHRVEDADVLVETPEELLAALS
jgi:pyrophosphatase PpaX